MPVRAACDDGERRQGRPGARRSIAWLGSGCTVALGSPDELGETDKRWSRTGHRDGCDSHIGATSPRMSRCRAWHVMPLIGPPHVEDDLLAPQGGSGRLQANQNGRGAKRCLHRLVPHGGPAACKGRGDWDAPPSIPSHASRRQNCLRNFRRELQPIAGSPEDRITDGHHRRLKGRSELRAADRQLT